MIPWFPPLQEMLPLFREKKPSTYIANICGLSLPRLANATYLHQKVTPRQTLDDREGETNSAARYLPILKCFKWSSYRVPVFFFAFTLRAFLGLLNPFASPTR
jgi:hypothetical protein